MKRLFIFVYAIFSICAILFTGCSSDMEDSTASYSGTVHEASSNEPFSNIDVKVTDGSNIHVATKTDNDGNFKITVKINEINGSYYLLVGDATCEPKKVTLPGYAAGTTNLGIILVEGPQLPTVETNSEYSVDVNNLRCGGVVKNSGRLNVTDRGICYSTSSYPTIDDNKVSEGKGEGAFDVVIKDLKVNTSYYFRAFATNAKGTAYGAQYQVKMEEGLPVVVNIKISDIKATSAICEGSITGDGGFEITKRGICWADHQLPTTSDHFVTDNGKTGKFALALSNLTPQTNYYVRAFAENSSGISYSEQVSFETISGLATVQTGDITNISSTSANCSGTISDTGGYSITKCGVCWSQTSSTPTVNDFHTEDVNLSGKFNSTISPLKASTEYYVRAYATNSMGTVYGQTKKFTTTDGMPTVQSVSVSQITSYSFSFTGSVTSDGGYEVTSRGVVWADHQNPTKTDNVVNNGKGKGQFTNSINNLEPNHIYYVRAFAENANGISYGNDIKVTTNYQVKGLVQNKNKQPIPYSTVIISQNKTTISNCNTDAQGQFAVSLPAGTYSLSASAEGYATNTINITAGSDLKVITLYELSSLSGKVVDDDNMPLANVTVTIHGDKDSRTGLYNKTASQQTDKNGYYSFGNLPFNGDCVIYCEKNNYRFDKGIELNLSDGGNSRDMQMFIIHSWSINNQYSGAFNIDFASYSAGNEGTQATQTLRVTNLRQIKQNWSISNVPGKGLTVNEKSGEIGPNGYVDLIFTFTYPGPGVSGCNAHTVRYVKDGVTYTKMYLWPWETAEAYSFSDSCEGFNGQLMHLFIGGSDVHINASYRSYVVWK